MKRVLVAYATKYGSTAEIAEKIGEALHETGLQADVLPAEQAGDVAPYDAVVLGSAVYAGSWRKEAVHFLEANEKRLAEIHALSLEAFWQLPRRTINQTLRRVFGPLRLQIKDGKVVGFIDTSA